jgi:hypothetical protein
MYIEKYWSDLCGQTGGGGLEFNPTLLNIVAYFKGEFFEANF